MLKELVPTTMKMLKNRCWSAVWGGALPGARAAEDIVMESVEDLVDGKRTFQESVPLRAVLIGIIRSKVHHLVNGLENRATRRVESQDAPDGVSVGTFDHDAHDASPDAHLMEKEAESANSRLLGLLVQELADDPPLVQLLECTREGYSKPEEIAELLCVKPSDVTNMKKRLERRLTAFRVKFADQNPFLETRK